MSATGSVRASRRMLRTRAASLSRTRRTAGISATRLDQLGTGVRDLSKRLRARVGVHTGDQIGEDANVPPVLDRIERGCAHAVVGRKTDDVDVDDAVPLEKLRGGRPVVAHAFEEGVRRFALALLQ